MAGSYPDVPGYRFAYDKDGTNSVIYFLNLGTNTTLTPSNMSILNNDYTDTTIATLNITHLAFVFPEARNISGILIVDKGPTNLAGSPTLDWSSDTSNGLDGTWNTVGPLNSYRQSTVLKTDFRLLIRPLAITGAIALRFSNGANSNPYQNVHLYGSIPTTNSPDRLRIVDLGSNDIAAQLDFGDIRQRNNVTKQFKVVNNSAAKTANNITVTLDIPTDASPTLVGQYQLSTDNTAFANAINIGTLAPGASSGTLYVRDTISATAQISVWSLRLIATPNTWS